MTNEELAREVGDDNPWRDFIENVINGDNYFRSSEYRELIADIDLRILAERKLTRALTCIADALEATGDCTNLLLIARDALASPKASA